MSFENNSVGSIRDLEKKSCAVSLSDMEMFIFPDLIYSLMLANIMSPILWRWRDDPWFKGIERKSDSAKITRLKQYIMDHYSFNLDLDTWGLTTKEQELKRFEAIVDPAMLSQSNALFGYEGDKYYFDLDIRTHFGLDKYEGNVIPYWKTETLEAMTAFSRCPGYETGAGECVSLAALYAAAIFVVLGIPLKHIFMLATPLHSQNFIDIGTGIVTNNRRIVTKNMWFNGTALSGQARRAMENERITLVAHETGTIHGMYPDASIDADVYAGFQKNLANYLSTPLTPEMFGNFLRQSPESHSCFLVRRVMNGVELYAPLARAFEYERDSNYKATDHTLPKLLDEMDQSEFSARTCTRCIVFNDMQDYLKKNPVNIHKAKDIVRLQEQFGSCENAHKMVDHLIQFCHTEPRMPNANEKQFMSIGEPLGIEPSMTREEIMARVEALRDTNEYCRWAFYAYRDLSRTESAPFMKAAIERNPVCLMESMERFADDDALIVHVRDTFVNESIYEAPERLAQPDEVWNFSAGDGLERALMLGVILNKRNGISYTVKIDGASVQVRSETGDCIVELPTQKSITEQELIIGVGSTNDN